MKAKVCLIVIVLIVSLVFSCSNSMPDGVTFSEESFHKTIQMTNGKIYYNDSLSIGHPSLIRFHPDSFLIIPEQNAPKLIKILDLKTNKIQEIISQGKGPGEMILSWGVETIGSNLYVFCSQLRKVIILRPDSGRTFQIIDEFSLEAKNTTTFLPLMPDNLLCLSSTGDDKRLVIMNSKGKIVKKMGDYPLVQNGNDNKGDNNIFQSVMSGSPSGKKFILACRLTDVLEVYDLDRGLLKRFQGPLGIHLSTSRKKVGTYTMTHIEPNYMTYRDVNSSENEFWVSYIGYKVEKAKRPSINDTSPKRIFCFDWKGKPLRKLEFENVFMAFDVDWKGGILYTINWQDENPKIIWYSLNNIL